MLPLSWHIYDHYAYAVVALGGTFLALLVGQWFIQRSPWAPWARSLQGVAPPFINIVGVLFGLTLAFLANDTWGAQSVNTKAIAPGWLKAAICSNVGLNTVVVTSVSEASRNP